MGKVVKVEPARAAPLAHRGADVRAVTRFGLVVVAVAFGGIGSWVALAPLSGAVIAPGVVKVDTNRKTIQHLEGGIVSEILVQNGDEVVAGQPLIVLTDERVSATLEVLSAQLDAEMAKAARLKAERDGEPGIRFPADLSDRAGNPQIAALMADETAFFEATRSRISDQLSLLTEQRAHANDEVSGLREQVTAEEAAAGYLRQEIGKNEALERRQYIQETQILALKRLLEDYLARRGEHLADTARARQKIADLELRSTTLRAEHVQSAADELTAVKARIVDLEERVRPSLDAQTRQRIVAPIAGTVVDLRINTVGGVVAPREPLLDIVPHEHPLIVEARVEVTRIDNLKTGMDCDVRLTAFRSRTTPLIPGRLTYVSADRLEDDVNHVPYYLAHVDLDPRGLTTAAVTLTAGMPAEVYFKTRSRTALEYLLEPITVFIARALEDD